MLVRNLNDKCTISELNDLDGNCFDYSIKK